MEAITEIHRMYYAASSSMYVCNDQLQVFLEKVLKEKRGNSGELDFTGE